MLQAQNSRKERKEQPVPSMLDGALQNNRTPSPPKEGRLNRMPAERHKAALTCPAQKTSRTVAMGLLPLPPNEVKSYLTLFSKYFSSFVRTTCSLSVSVQYLAFAEVHLRFCTALSNCTTLGIRRRGGIQAPDRNGTIALLGETFQNAWSGFVPLTPKPRTTIPLLPIPFTVDNA